jgi:outer membrane lipoprotein LolB
MAWSKRSQNLSAINNWTINGKIGVATARDAGSASVEWQQWGTRYALAFTGPLGAGGMKLKGQPGLVTLTTTDGKHLQADSAEDLLAQAWGYKVPVSYLAYWIRGLPTPALAAQTQFDAYNRLTYLAQQGWQIQYLGYTHTNKGDLPNRINIQSANLRVKVIIYSWLVS